MMQFTYVDGLIFAAIFLSGMIGAWRGLVKELLSMAGWAAASFALVYGFDPLQPVTRDFIKNPALADMLTGTILFAGTLIVVSFITHYLAKWVKGSAFGGADRSLGFIFGFLRGALIVVMVFFVFAAAMPEPEEYPEPLRDAKSLPYLQAGNTWLADMLQKHRGDASGSLEQTLKDDTNATDQDEGIDPPGP
jgi:membrane protein required for colicin V production